jgi:hypothetical protein
VVDERGPGTRRLVIDVDSTICEVEGKKKQGAAFGYTKVLGYHPLLASRADTGECCMPACARDRPTPLAAPVVSSTSSSLACVAPAPPARW